MHDFLKDTATTLVTAPAPPPSDALLTRERVAAALTAHGYTISPRTLATKACRGGGPPYVFFNSRALYRWADALAWAQAMTSRPTSNTSERNAA